jgi:hypothetical protein
MKGSQSEWRFPSGSRPAIVVGRVTFYPKLTFSKPGDKKGQKVSKGAKK